MAKVVNVRRDVDDKFYRYKMPELLTKIEGKGNGIKTVLPNVSDVARSLSRPPTYPTKFFGFELGAQTVIEEKNDRYIVNGAHDASRLRELLDTFIEKFVLCGSCQNPETDLIITKNDDIYRDCKACGQKTYLDARHKLTSYITRNPPKTGKGKKSKGAHATANANGGTGNPDDAAGAGGGEDDDDDAFTKKIKEEAAGLPSADQIKVDENDWSLDTSAEAVRARQLASGMNNLTVNEDEQEEEFEDPDSPYTVIKTWAIENRDDATGVDVYKKAQELGIETKYKTVQVLARFLFTEKIVAELPNFVALFKKMVGDSEKHQKALLGGIEAFLGLDHPDLIPQIPKILMVFYQADVLDEDFLKHWGSVSSKKYVDKETSKKVRKASDPFLKWLDEADDDDEEDDDDDE